MRKITFLVMVSFVFTLSASAMQLDRWSRCLRNPDLRVAMQNAEKSYQARCLYPRESEAEWYCLNGPECGYHFVVKCSSPSGVLTLSVDGFDDGNSNSIDRIQVTPPSNSVNN